MTPRASHRLMEDAIQLTQREIEIMTDVAQGLASRSIAQRRGIVESTVKTHIRNVFQKLGAHNKAHAAAIMVGEGLIILPPSFERRIGRYNQQMLSKSERSGKHD